MLAPSINLGCNYRYRAIWRNKLAFNTAYKCNIENTSIIICILQYWLYFAVLTVFIILLYTKIPSFLLVTIFERFQISRVQFLMCIILCIGFLLRAHRGKVLPFSIPMQKIAYISNTAAQLGQRFSNQMRKVNITLEKSKN